MTSESHSNFLTVHIRNMSLPKKPRVFDVLVDGDGHIIKYLIQNIQGFLYVDMDEVEFQIREALKKAS